MNKLLSILSVIIAIFLYCCTGNTDVMMERTSNIEKGMSKIEVEKILQTKPHIINKINNPDKGKFILCYYDLGHPFGYYYVVTFSNNKDSIVIFETWH